MIGVDDVRPRHFLLNDSAICSTATRTCTARQRGPGNLRTLRFHSVNADPLQPKQRLIG